MICIVLFSLLALTSAQYAAPASAPAAQYAPPPPAPAPTPVYGPPAPAYGPPAVAPIALAPAPALYPVPAPIAPAAAPAPVYAAPAPAPVYAAPAPAPTYGPPAPAYGVPNKEGGELLSEFAPAPVAPAPAPAPSPSYGTPNKEGGDLLSEEVAIPPNTRVELHDDRNQYSHGFSDDKGTQIAEQGRLISTNGGWEYVLAKSGTVRYVTPEGPVSFDYVADENGYRIMNLHVPGQQ